MDPNYFFLWVFRARKTEQCEFLSGVVETSLDRHPRQSSTEKAIHTQKYFFGNRRGKYGNGAQQNDAG